MCLYLFHSSQERVGVILLEIFSQFRFPYLTVVVKNVRSVKTWQTPVHSIRLHSSTSTHLFWWKSLEYFLHHVAYIERIRYETRKLYNMHGQFRHPIIFYSFLAFVLSIVLSLLSYSTPWAHYLLRPFPVFYAG